MTADAADYHLCKFDGGPLDGQRHCVSELVARLAFYGSRELGLPAGIYRRSGIDRMSWQPLERGDVLVPSWQARAA